MHHINNSERQKRSEHDSIKRENCALRIEKPRQPSGAHRRQNQARAAIVPPQPHRETNEQREPAAPPQNRIPDRSDGLRASIRTAITVPVIKERRRSKL